MRAVPSVVQSILTLERERQHSRSFSVSPSKLALIVSCARAGLLPSFFDYESIGGVPTRVIQAISSSLDAFAFSEDGSRIAIAEDYTIQ